MDTFFEKKKKQRKKANELAKFGWQMDAFASHSTSDRFTDWR